MNTPTTRTSPTTNDRRENALARYKAAEAAIGALFDAAAVLRSRLDHSLTVAAGSDVLRAALDIIDLAAELPALVADVRAAGDAATDYATRPELAGHLDTKTHLLFPRPATPTSAAPSRLPVPPVPHDAGTTV